MNCALDAFVQVGSIIMDWHQNRNKMSVGQFNSLSNLCLRELNSFAVPTGVGTVLQLRILYSLQPTLQAIDHDLRSELEVYDLIPNEPSINERALYEHDSEHQTLAKYPQDLWRSSCF